MTIQVVAMTSINPDSETALEEYLSVVGPLMQLAGAKVISRFECRDNIVGDNGVQYISVIEYPDHAAVKTVFDSEEYKSLDKIKHKAFSVYQVSTATTLQ